MEPATNSINENLPLNLNEMKKRISKNKNYEPDLRIAVLKKNHLQKIKKESEFRQKLSSFKVTPADNTIPSKYISSQQESTISCRFRHYFSCFSR